MVFVTAVKVGHLVRNDKAVVKGGIENLAAFLAASFHGDFAKTCIPSGLRGFQHAVKISLRSLRKTVILSAFRIDRGKADTDCELLCGLRKSEKVTVVSIRGAVSERDGKERGEIHPTVRSPAGDMTSANYTVIRDCLQGHTVSFRIS